MEERQNPTPNNQEKNPAKNEARESFVVRMAALALIIFAGILLIALLMKIFLEQYRIG